MLPTKDRKDNDKRKNLRVAVLSTNASELLKQHELLARSAGIEMTTRALRRTKTPYSGLELLQTAQTLRVRGKQRVGLTVQWVNTTENTQSQFNCSAEHVSH